MLVGKTEVIEKFLATTTLDESITSREKARTMYNEIMVLIQNELTRGNDVKLEGIGTFKIKWHKARQVRNIKTKELTTVPPKRVVKFEATRKFKDIINESA